MSRNPPDDDYPRSDGSKRPKAFEIQGDWADETSPPELKLDDSKPVQREVPPDRPTSRLDTPASSSLEERVTHLEKMMQLTWKVVHDLEGKRGKEGE